MAFLASDKDEAELGFVGAGVAGCDEPPGVGAREVEGVEAVAAIAVAEYFDVLPLAVRVQGLLDDFKPSVFSIKRLFVPGVVLEIKLDALAGVVVNGAGVGDAERDVAYGGVDFEDADGVIVEGAVGAWAPVRDVFTGACVGVRDFLFCFWREERGSGVAGRWIYDRIA